MDLELVAAIAGYVSTPLVSLATLRRWPSELRFSIALAVAVGAALAGLAAGGEEITRSSFAAAFGVVFAAQQITWRFRVPGAGSPALNGRLEIVGDRAAGGQDEEDAASACEVLPDDPEPGG